MTWTAYCITCGKQLESCPNGTTVVSPRGAFHEYCVICLRIGAYRRFFL